MTAATTVTNGHHPQGKPPALAASTLPSAQSSELILARASQIEYDQTSWLNGEEWRGPLTISQYLQREMHLQDQVLTRNDQITGWILTSEDLPRNNDGTRPILASSESLLVCGYIAHRGVLRKVLAHGIGSVYTRPEHRGKGYAGSMMAKLGKRLETWQQPNGSRGSFSVLYSDIGQKFYSRFGWKVYPSTHIHLPPVSGQQYDEMRQNLPGTTDLEASDLANIPTALYMEERLQRLSKEKPEVPFVTIRPDIEHFAWHHAREEFLSKVLGKKFPQIKGAIHKPTGVALIWSRVFAANPQDWQLHVLHVVLPPHLEGSTEAEEALAALIVRAQLEAGEWNMAGGVEIWDPAPIVVSSAQRLQGIEKGKVNIVSRDKEHICSLRWSVPDVGDDQVVWVANEKYAWC